MRIFPAIDLVRGQVVRLTQGDYTSAQVYSDSPAATAQGFEAMGARCLHVVDLDGAKDGGLSNYSVIEDIVRATGLFVEVGGGIRTRERVEQYLRLGVGRVILGTAALKDEAFLCAMLKRYGEKIAVGVDARDGFVATDGWLQVSRTDSVAFCRKMRTLGVRHIIYTDISRDGAMQGTNLEIYRTLSAVAGLSVTASGGISTLAELQQLRAMGVSAAILGKSLYVGAIRLSDALRVAGDEA